MFREARLPFTLAQLHGLVRPTEEVERISASLFVLGAP
jgi:hypothetical protein